MSDQSNAPDTTANAAAAQTSPPTVPVQIQTFIDGVFSTLIKDEAVVLKPIVTGYLTNIVNNPSAENVVVQSLAFVPAVQAALPNIEATASKDIATALLSFVNTNVPGLIAEVAAKV